MTLSQTAGELPGRGQLEQAPVAGITPDELHAHREPVRAVHQCSSDGVLVDKFNHVG